MKNSTIWPNIHLDRSPRAPTLRRQIERQIASAIGNGTLRHDCRLPSSRVMAHALAVSRGTVVDAYEALIAAGLLVATAGSGIRIAAASLNDSNLCNPPRVSRSCNRPSAPNSCILPSVPTARSLVRTVISAHYPARIFHVDDPDGTSLYFNAVG